MKKLFVFFLVVIFLVGLAATVGVKIYGEPQIKKLIETQGSKALGGPVSVGEVHLVLWPPVSLEIQNLRVQGMLPPVSMTVPMAKATVPLSGLLSGKVVAQININNPQVNYTVVTPPPGAPPPPAGSTKGFSPENLQKGIKFGVDLWLKNASVVVTQNKDSYAMKNLNVHFLAQDLNAPWNLEVTTNIDLQNPIPLSLPAKITSQFVFDGDALKLNQSIVELGGLRATLAGKSVISREEHAYDLAVDIPDLRSFIVPPQIVNIVKSWAGLLKGNIHLEHTKNTNWRAQGSLTAQDFALDTNFNSNGTEVTGPVKANVAVDFAYQNDLVLNKLETTVDLTESQIHTKELVKPKGVAVTGQIVADENQNILNLKIGNFVFGPIKVSSHGLIDSRPNGQSSMAINCPSTSLDGLEKFFPALAGHPLTGRIEAQGTLKGDIHEPKNLSVSINPLTLEKVKGSVDWVSADKKSAAKGAAFVDGKVVLVTQGQRVNSATVNLQGDLSGLEIELAEQFKKRINAPLKLVIKAAQKGQALQINQGTFVTEAGTFNLSGHVQNPSNPSMSLSLKVPKVDFAAASRMIPMLQPWNLSGEAHGQITLSGFYNLKEGITKSPLVASGQITAHIPQFVYKENKPTKPGQAPVTVAPTSHSSLEQTQSLLPDWPLFRNLNLSSQFTLGSVKYGDLNVGDIKSTFKIQGGTFTGSASLGRIFGGQFSAQDLHLKLLVPLAPLDGKMNFTRIDLTQALAWGAPKWKDDIKGLASGQMQVHLASHQSKNFLAETQVKGSADIKNGFLSTVAFDQYVNQKLAGIPGLNGKTKVNTGGQAMEVKSQFDFGQSRLMLQSLNAITPEKNELQASGPINLDQSLDLKGTAYIATAGISGDMTACLGDKMGRLVVPLHITGTASSPQYNIVEGTVQALASKMINCQAKKLQNSIQDQLKDRVQDEAKKSLLKMIGQ